MTDHERPMKTMRNTSLFLIFFVIIYALFNYVNYSSERQKMKEGMRSGIDQLQIVLPMTIKPNMTLTKAEYHDESIIHYYQVDNVSEETDDFKLAALYANDLKKSVCGNRQLQTVLANGFTHRVIYSSSTRGIIMDIIIEAADCDVTPVSLMNILFHGGAE